ncbi:putative Major facilitator superfamily (MFS) profile domain-containing protein [Seiridium cardinale]
MASVMGQVSFGYLWDRINNILILVFASSFISSVAAFCLCGFTRSLGAFLAFSLPILSLMAFGKGVGNIVTAPITTGLMTESASSGYGLGKFQAVILFLGASKFCSSLGIFGWPLQQCM